MEKLNVADLIKSANASRDAVFRLLWENIPQYRNSLTSLYRNTGQNTINLACFNQEKIAGACIGGHINDNVAYLNFFFVIPEFRQEGIGQLLMNSFESKVKEDKRKRIECEIHDERIARWFERRGYSEIEGRKNYPILLRNQPEITMFKDF